MKISNHQYLTKVFQDLQKKLGITTNGLLNICNWSIKNKCVDMVIAFMSLSIERSHSSLDRIIWHREPGRFTSARTSRKFTIDSVPHRNLCIGTFWRDSGLWKRLKVHLFHGRDRHLSHDQVIQWTEAKVRVYSDSVPCLGKMSLHSEAIGRWEGQVLDFQMSAASGELLGIDGEAPEFEWNIYPGFRPLQILQEFQNELQKRNIELEKFTDRIIITSMFTDIDWTRNGNDENCISNSEIVKMYAKRFSQGRRTFLGLGDEKKRYGNRNYKPEGKWNSVASQMVQRFKETGHPVFTSASALSRGVLRMLKGKETIHFNADASNTELLFRIIHSVNHLSIFGAVSNCCEQVGWTTDEKGREKLSQKESPWTKKYQRAWIHKKWTLWCLNWYLETDCGKTFKTSNYRPRLFNSQRFANSHRSCTGYRLVWATWPFRTRTTVVEIPSQYAENTHVFEQTHYPELAQQFLGK